ncbi:SCO1 protein [Pseudovirgaria hyperparasitica]|uniref:SCO1 protein n=1 Tax=Pseudovirgaria hyperparasitica TaxID=470096 RepID=A0A6A6W361_9PEZI|nr:SCO1 protein [Pseudovirgaria hyperparasitica]KAF2757378.1 SCO1 protein [Pseudovirgaria hyperparasitica]
MSQSGMSSSRLPATCLRMLRASSDTICKPSTRNFTSCQFRRPTPVAAQLRISRNALPSSAHHRLFSSTIRQHAKTVQQVKARNESGPFSWRAGILFFATGAGLIVYFKYEKERMQRQRIAEQNKGIGKPLVGGKFELKDSEGNIFTEDDLKGKYSLIYFGFTHCPDICPDELDKMAQMIDIVKQKKGNILKAVFISCDPWRDSPEVVKKYLAEFHPDIVGLTGDYDNVKAVCKAYRVYFSTPPELKPGQDYLVDHSIYFYLMDPEGDFVEAIGRERTAEQGAKAICDFASDWKGKINRE